jgi:hypothetical protein
MSKLLMTKNPSVIALLRKLGMPEGCVSATINFNSNEVVTVDFRCALRAADTETLQLLVDGGTCTDGASVCNAN